MQPIPLLPFSETGLVLVPEEQRVNCSHLDVGNMTLAGRLGGGALLPLALRAECFRLLA